MLEGTMLHKKPMRIVHFSINTPNYFMFILIEPSSAETGTYAFGLFRKKNYDFVQIYSS